MQVTSSLVYSFKEMRDVWFSHFKGFYKLVYDATWNLFMMQLEEQELKAFSD